MNRVLIIDGKEPNAGVGGVSAADFSHFSNRFLTAGVLGDTDYLVEAQATPDMTVKYAAGGAYVEDTTGTFNIPVEDDTGGNVTIEPNVSGNDRIDTIVIAIDTTTTPNENADNIIEVRAVEGTPAGSPTALTDNEIQTALGAGYAWLKLAEVTVENGAVSITTADVSDIREEVGFTLASASAGIDGWTEAGETWTYASPTTFTVSGDVTAKYQKGTRIKLTQTSVKYFVVTNSVHAAGTTTVTITGGTDYTLTNAAISANYYSYQASPQGYPVRFALASDRWLSSLGKQFTIMGHSSIIGTGTNYKTNTDTKSFGITFASQPMVYLTPMGVWGGGYGSAQNEEAGFAAILTSVSTTQFTMKMNDVSGTTTHSGKNYYYTYLAIGII